MNRWLAAHPVAGFAIFTFAISYLLGIPWLVLTSGAVPERFPLLRVYLARLVIVYGPAIAALVMASSTPSGVRDLLLKLVPSRGDVAAAAAILSAGISVTAAALLISGTNLTVEWARVRANLGLFVAHLTLQLLCIAVGEELGWRGWLLPVLSSRMSRLRAAIVTGAIWTVWHGPRLIDRPAAVVLFSVSVLGLSFVFTWLWSQASHRLFPVVVAHAVVNAPMFFLEQTGALAADRLAMAWRVCHVFYTILGVTLVLRQWDWWTARPHSPRGEWLSAINSPPETEHRISH